MSYLQNLAFGETVITIQIMLRTKEMTKRIINIIFPSNHNLLQMIFKKCDIVLCSSQKSLGNTQENSSFVLIVAVACILNTEFSLSVERQFYCHIKITFGGLIFFILSFFSHEVPYNLVFIVDFFSGRQHHDLKPEGYHILN